MLLAERLTGDADGRDGAGHEGPRSPHEEIHDFFHRRQNCLHDTDLAAERLAGDIGIAPGDVLRALTAAPADRHGVRLTAETGSHLHHHDEATRTLHLSNGLRPGQRAFRRATQLALLAYGDELDRLAAQDFPAGSPTYALARIANCFAAALILPHRTFHAADEEVRHDIERLTDRFGPGCELRHASRLVHSDGLDLDNSSAATPIGMGCRVCERLDCPQRAVPPLGRPLRIDQNSSTFVPYPVARRPE